MKKLPLTLFCLSLFLLAACGQTTITEQPSDRQPVVPENTEITIPPTDTAAAPEAPEATQSLPETLFYDLQEGSPAYTIYPDGCDGLYIAGQVFDPNEVPVIFVEIRLGGVLDGQPLYEESALSGNAQQWGLSGYEIKINDTLADSSGTVYVQLFDLETEAAVSEIIVFDTYNDCSRNLTLLNFIQVSSGE